MPYTSGRNSAESVGVRGPSLSLQSRVSACGWVCNRDSSLDQPAQGHFLCWWGCSVTYVVQSGGRQPRGAAEHQQCGQRDTGAGPLIAFHVDERRCKWPRVAGSEGVGRRGSAPQSYGLASCAHLLSRSPVTQETFSEPAPRPGAELKACSPQRSQPCAPRDAPSLWGTGPVRRRAWCA